MNEDLEREVKLLIRNNKAFWQYYFSALEKLEARIERLEDLFDLLEEHYERLEKEVLSRVAKQTSLKPGGLVDAGS